MTDLPNQEGPLRYNSRSALKIQVTGTSVSTISTILHTTTPLGLQNRTEQAHILQTRALISALNRCDLSALTLRRFNAGERPLARLERVLVGPQRWSERGGQAVKLT